MQIANEFNDIGVSPSFNWYSTDNSTSTAATKVSREVKQEHYDEFSDIEEEEDFEFSVEFEGEKFSTKDLALNGRILLPIFNTDLVTKDEAVDHGINEFDIDHDDNSSSSLVIPLEKLLISNESSSYSSSEADDQMEPDDNDDDKVSSSGTFCVSWRKSDARSQNLEHIKKSKSTGTGTGSESGSRRWKIKDILRRSNSAGKETVFFLCPKRVEASNKKRVVPKGAGKMKTSPSIHEMFYVQKRAELKGDKKKSYLPYRQDLLGFKVHVVNGNGNGNKKLPF